MNQSQLPEHQASNRTLLPNTEHRGKRECLTPRGRALPVTRLAIVQSISLMMIYWWFSNIFMMIFRPKQRLLTTISEGYDYYGCMCHVRVRRQVAKETLRFYDSQLCDVIVTPISRWLAGMFLSSTPRWNKKLLSSVINNSSVYELKLMQM